MPLALVTGGAIRVGRAISLALGREGYDVVVHARRSVEEAQGVKAELERMGRRAFVELADLGTDAELDGLVARLASAHRSLDLLVHSAARYEHRPFAEVSRADFDAMFAVNARAPFFLTQGLLPLLRAAPAPAIVTITDMAVQRAYTASHHFAHYLASKAALERLTRSLALELGPAIRVNAVAPGPVAMAAETTEAQASEILKRVPLGREGRPEDVAQAVVFLARAAYVTGHTLVVDGGLSVA
jgi:pteridine reductase